MKSATNTIFMVEFNFNRHYIQNPMAGSENFLLFIMKFKYFFLKIFTNNLAIFICHVMGGQFI
jgi:hypothetical protein